jgi:hypothetical protein
MKTILIAAILIWEGVARPQGSINFDNRTSDNNAPIYNVDPTNPTEIKRGQTATGVPTGSQTYRGALVSGTGITATLWASESSSATGTADANNLLQLIATTTFRPQTSGAFAGRVAALPANPTVPGVYCRQTWDIPGTNME